MGRQVAHIGGDRGKATVVVGWDNPMRTFFAQVYYEGERVDDSETPHEQCGTDYGEMPEVEPLLSWLSERGFILPDEHVAGLGLDRGTALPRTQHQKLVESMLTGRTPPDA